MKEGAYGSGLKIAGFLFAASILMYSCIDPYQPPEITTEERYLVIDGLLDQQSGEASVKLTRTLGLTEDGEPAIETEASVAIENEDGESYHLIENTPGQYTLADLNIQDDELYRLRVITQDGKEYLSEFVSVKRTPEIDSVTWRLTDEGVQISVNTHDPQNNTWYYKWDYEETWEFTSAFASSFIYDPEDSAVLPRPFDQQIYHCWSSQRSSEIIVNTSNRLSQDVISEFPIAFVPGSSTKLSILYSILVRQHALSREVYEYWNILETTTENLGSIFDPQPTELRGNISCVSNPGEVTIGYFSAVSTAEKRIFIYGSQTGRWQKERPFQWCLLEVDTLLASEVPTSLERRLIIAQLLFEPVETYTVAPASCIDCRYFGVNEKPDFWLD